MRSTRSLVLVAIVVFCIIVLPAPLAGASARMQTPPAADACRFPDAIAALGRHAEAATQYLVLLEGSPGLQCAEDGYLAAINSFDPFVAARALVADGDESAAAEEIRRVSEAYPGAVVPDDLAHLVSPPEPADPFAAVRALNNAGLITEAKAAFAKVVQENFKGPVPEDLKHLGQAADPFAAVRALDDEGLVTDAKSAFAEVVKANPDAEVPSDLRHLDGRQSLSCDWSNPQDCAQSITNWSTEKLKWFLPLAGLVFAGWLVLKGLWALIRNPSRPRVDIADFETSSTGNSFGKAFAESVQSFYYHAGDAHNQTNIKLIQDAAADKQTDVPAGLPGDPVNLALSFYNWVKGLLLKTYVLHGTTVQDPALGAGIVLVLQTRNKVEATATIWYRHFLGKPSQDKDDASPETEDFIALSETAAIRLYSWMANRHPDRATKSEVSSTTVYHSTWKEWEGFALFRNSVRVAMWGDERQAISLLNASLDKDRHFLPARMNLATLQLQSRAKSTPPQSNATDEECKRYRAVLRALWEGRDVAGKDKTLEPRLLFNYLAAIDYTAGWSADGYSCEDYHCVTELQSVLKRMPPSSAEISESLDVLDDTLTLRMPRRSDADAVLDKYQTRFNDPFKSTESFGYRAWYSLACLCAAAFKFVPESQKSFWAEHGLRNLSQALQLEAQVAEWASVDPSLTPFRTSGTYRPKFNTLVKKDDVKKPSQTPPV